MTDFINRTPVPDAEAAEGPLVRIKGSDGQDTINHGGVAYTRRDDGSFMVPASIVQHLIHGAGFKLAPLSQGKRLSRVFEAIRALDEGPAKNSLWASAVTAAYVVAGLQTPPPAPSSA